MNGTPGLILWPRRWAKNLFAAQASPPIASKCHRRRPGIPRSLSSVERGAHEVAVVLARLRTPPWPLGTSSCCATGSLYRPKRTCPPQFCIAPSGPSSLNLAIDLDCDLGVVRATPVRFDRGCPPGLRRLRPRSRPRPVPVLSGPGRHSALRPPRPGTRSAGPTGTSNLRLLIFREPHHSTWLHSPEAGHCTRAA
jgi:hypothetical protein